MAGHLVLDVRREGNPAYLPRTTPNAPISLVQSTLPVMAEMRMIEAVRAAITEEMERDDRVLVMGEDVGKKGGVFGATDGLYARFGEARVLDTPLAESGIVGVAVGAALNGL